MKTPSLPKLSRRRFLASGAGLVAGSFALAPVRILGRGGEPPSDRLNLVFVGVGGRGAANLAELAGENVIGLCDVDESRAAEARRQHPKARFDRDFRRLLDAVGREADGVVISTPDHTHAVVALRALQMGKHVYCEKPLGHSLGEIRRLTLAAREARVATQLGNQGHSSESIRTFCEMIRAGALGPVREVHAFAQNSYCPREYRTRPPETPPVPPGLDWDLWLGPAPARPYHPVYHPGKWRGWVDFGTGIVGDWVCHVLDPIFWALELDAPVAVTARALEYDDPRVRAETFPPGCVIVYEFPARGERPPVKVTWYEGACPPPRPAELEPARQLPQFGAIIVGDRGKALHGSHGAGGWQLLPRARDQAYQRPPPSLPRVPGHHADWVRACKGGPVASANWNYGGLLAEVALLGVLAQRFNGQRLEWDARNLRVTNFPPANAFIDPPYREGWKG
jgi:predicted dehydrogenase